MPELRAVSIHRCRGLCISDYGKFIELRGDAGRLFLPGWAELRRMGEFAVSVAEAMQPPAEAGPALDTAGESG